MRFRLCATYDLGTFSAERRTLPNLPLVSREWKNGSNSSYNCTPFLYSLLTKGKL